MFALLAIATGAQAMSYNLWIAGIQVTDENKNNITGPGISAEHFTDGKVWYNSDDNILTLENVHIVNSNPTGWVEGIFSMIENLTIVVKGSHNLVESRYNHAILSYSSLTFGDGEQDGILKVVGKLHGIAVWNEKNYLTIKNGVRLEVESTESSALYANYAKSGIYIETGTTMLMATSKESNAISGFGFVSYYGSIELCKPQGKSYDKTNRVLGDPKETVVYGRRIKITNTAFPDDKLYDEIQKFNTDGNGYLDRDEIYEAQTLSRMNIANYTGISYLWDLRKILVNYTLDDSNYYNLDVKSNPFLEMIYSAQGGHLFSIDNLWACPWLEEVGLYKNHLNLIDVSQNTRLKILQVEDNSIWHVYPPTRLEECLPFASYYIYDNEISSNFMDELIASLPVNNTNKEYRIYVKSEYGDKEQNVCTDQQMNAILEKGWIPAVRTNVNEYKDHSYTYDLTIGGNIKVTEANAHDIMGDGGGISYDPTTKTLSLMNDYEFSTNGIESHIDGLTIKCVDNSTLDCQSDAIDLYANTTITGNHQLAVKSKIGVGIFVDDGKNLTIDNATLEMSAQMPCILGATTTGSQKLNIKDSEIEAHSNSSSVAISGFPAGINFEGCAITEPAGGYVKDGNIVDKNGNLAYDVKIQKVDETVFSFALGDGIKQVDTYGNEQFTAINVLWTADILDSTYDQTTKTTTFFNKASGKNLFTLEPYNAKGDMAYFLCEGVTAEDAISYDFSDDRSWLVNAVYDYLNSYDAEDAEAFLVKYNSINLSFDIPAVPATEQWVGTMRNGMKLEEDETTLAASFVLLVLGDLTYESADDGSSSYYNAATNKLLFTLNSDGIVTLGSGVTSADAVTHRIIQADREMMAEGLESLRSITLTFDDGAATGITQQPTPSTQHPVYNLSGQRVGSSYRGIAVSNDRKVVIK